MSPRRPARPASSGSTPARPAPVSDMLRATVVAQRRLEAARPLDGTARNAECRAIDRMLRSVIDRHPLPPEAASSGRSALRVACAHLAVGDIENAYFALLTARDLWAAPM